MLNWVWIRLKAMHWAAKLFSVVFFIHACLLLGQAYQLKHLEVPPFNELHRAEGKLILVKHGRDWLTGVEHPDGSQELFTCKIPGTGLSNICFYNSEVEKFKLNHGLHAVILWYPLRVPLEDRDYRYIFQIQINGADVPLSYTSGLGKKIEFSYRARGDFSHWKTESVRSNMGLAAIYGLGIIFLFFWESFKYSTKGNKRQRGH